MNFDDLVLAALLFATSVAAAACDDDTTGPPEVELRTDAACPDGAPAFDVVVDRSLSPIGASGNQLLADGDALWIVESGANTVSRFDRVEEQLDSGFVHVGSERNPYGADVDDESSELWIANLVSDTVTVADSDSGDIVDEIEDPSFADPSAIALTASHAYVANVDFRGPAEGYGPGTLSVIDRQRHEVVDHFETAFRNPHFLSVQSVDGENVLFVSAAGELEMDDQQVRVVSEGGLEWFDIEANPVDPPAESFPIGQDAMDTVGAPGYPSFTPAGDRLYFASAIAPVVFAFDLDARNWIYDVQSPLHLYESDGDTTHGAAMGPDGLLWITAFNDDALYLLDTACDELVAGPIDLGEVADMLEGPQALAVFDNGTAVEGYFLLSVANALGRVRLQ